MRLLVTGATGFLGAPFVEAATARGHEVVALVRRPTERVEQSASSVVVADLPKLGDAVLPNGIDAVVNFATGTSGTTERMIDVAVGGVTGLTQWARGSGARRFVHVSSVSVLPGRTDGSRLEPHPDRRGGYAQAKTLAEQALHELDVEQLPFELTIVRPGLVFGPGMKNPLGGTAARLPGRVALGLGKRRHALPFVTLEDTVDAVLDLLEQPARPGTVSVHHILSGSPPRKEEILAETRRLTGWPARTIWIPRPAASTLAYAAEAVLRLRGRGKHLPYVVRRLYSFDARSLPNDVWPKLGRESRGTLEPALRDVLSPRRQPALVCAYRDRIRPLLVHPAAARGDARPLALVGAGQITSSVHVPVLRTPTGFTPAVVVDRDEELAAHVAAELGCRRSAATLDEAGIEPGAGWTAVVATPGPTHSALASDLLDRGAGVLLEKPAATSGVEFTHLLASAERNGLPVTVFHNYRLRPASRRLWEFLTAHDPGGLVRAGIGFSSPGLHTQASSWMREEKRNRILLMDLAIHFLDLAFLVGGELATVSEVDVADGPDGGTLAVDGSGRLADGARLDFSLDLAGTAQRAQITLEFERATCVLDFFPDGFRILPPRAHPADDLIAASGRLGRAVWALARRRSGGLPTRAVPHAEIYRWHRATLDDPALDSPFALASLAPTMRSLDRICAAVYGGGE
ncbi:MAG TPA: Gfo/Idh/MocA family oxidoreductase [Gaiellaceae bacterium]|nr:Gfo/Idh/MocA family oxidoreductase [Gaiellaceae bacterium]